MPVHAVPGRPAAASEWSAHDVGCYLEDLRLGEFRRVFAEQNVTGESLLLLTDGDLQRTFGMSQFWPRQRLLLGLAKLRGGPRGLPQPRSRSVSPQSAGKSGPHERVPQARSLSPQPTGKGGPPERVPQARSLSPQPAGKGGPCRAFAATCPVVAPGGRLRAASGSPPKSQPLVSWVSAGAVATSRAVAAPAAVAEAARRPLCQQRPPAARAISGSSR